MTGAALQDGPRVGTTDGFAQNSVNPNKSASNLNSSFPSLSLSPTKIPSSQSEFRSSFNFQYHFNMDDAIAKKLSHPEQSIADWVHENPTIKHAKVSSGLKYPPHRAKIDVVLMKPKEYAIRPNCSKETDEIAHRSRNDFSALREALVTEFPAAFVPVLPKERTKSAMDTFLSYILANPFFRNHYLVEKFLDVQVKNFNKSLLKIQKDIKKSKKAGSKVGKNGKSSEIEENEEGAVRWLQAISCYENKFEGDFKKKHVEFMELKEEFKRILNYLKAFHHNVLRVMELHEQAAQVYLDMNNFFQNMLVCETNVTKLSVDASMAGTMANSKLDSATENTLQCVHKQMDIYRRDFGPPMLQRKLLDPIQHEINVVNLWLKHIEYAEKETKLFAAGKNREKVGKDLSMLYQGLFGIELDIHRLYRIAKLERIQQNLANFHIHGAEKMYLIWKEESKFKNPHSCHGSNLDVNEDDVKEAFFKRGHFFGRGRKRTDNLGPKCDVVFLRVKELLRSSNNLLPAFTKGKTFLKIKPGERLIAQKSAFNEKKGVYFATNANGKQGLVLQQNVIVLQSLDVERSKLEGLINAAPIRKVDTLNTSASTLVESEEITANDIHFNDETIIESDHSNKLMCENIIGDSERVGENASVHEVQMDDDYFKKQLSSPKDEVDFEQFSKYSNKTPEILEVKNNEDTTSALTKLENEIAVAEMDAESVTVDVEDVESIVETDADEREDKVEDPTFLAKVLQNSTSVMKWFGYSKEGQLITQGKAGEQVQDELNPPANTPAVENKNEAVKVDAGNKADESLKQTDGPYSSFLQTFKGLFARRSSNEGLAAVGLDAKANTQSVEAPVSLSKETKNDDKDESCRSDAEKQPPKPSEPNGRPIVPRTRAGLDQYIAPGPKPLSMNLMKTFNAGIRPTQPIVRLNPEGRAKLESLRKPTMIKSELKIESSTKIKPNETPLAIKEVDSIKQAIVEPQMLVSPLTSEAVEPLEVKGKDNMLSFNEPKIDVGKSGDFASKTESNEGKQSKADGFDDSLKGDSNVTDVKNEKPGPPLGFLAELKSLDKENALKKTEPVATEGNSSNIGDTSAASIRARPNQLSFLAELSSAAKNPEKILKKVSPETIKEDQRKKPPMKPVVSTQDALFSELRGKLQQIRNVTREHTEHREEK